MRWKFSKLRRSHRPGTHGVLFSRLPDGRIAFWGIPTTAPAMRQTKLVMPILHELVNNLRRYGVQIYDEWYVMRLILEDGGAKIVMYRILDGQLAVVRAKAVMFATGGYGRVYNTTSNDYASTGDGLAMTAIAGLPLRIWSLSSSIPLLYPVGVLISERCAGCLSNQQSKAIGLRSVRSQSNGVGSRDITSRATARENSCWSRHSSQWQCWWPLSIWICVTWVRKNYEPNSLCWEELIGCWALTPYISPSQSGQFTIAWVEYL